MSLIAGVNFVLFGIMVADSRVTFDSQPPVRRDVCQKLFPLSEAGVISWCGDLDTATPLITAIVDAHRRAGPWFLLDEAATRTVLNPAILAACPLGTAHFITQLINPHESAYEGHHEPRIDMSVIDVRIDALLASVRVERVYMNYAVRGSGDVISAKMKKMDLTMTAWKAGRPRFGDQAMIDKCLAVEQIVRSAADAECVESVGGLYQVAYVLQGGVRALAYDVWVPCGNGAGTYATLDIAQGRSDQVHEATSRRELLLNPFIERAQIESGHAQDLTFDLRRLRLEDPGVMRRKDRRGAARGRSIHPVYVQPSS
jgi:hypothetical protein